MLWIVSRLDSYPEFKTDSIPKGPKEKSNSDRLLMEHKIAEPGDGTTGRVDNSIPERTIESLFALTYSDIC